MLPSGCVGHDEPSLSFYSDLPGSAGNLSWNATLPQDASPTQNQSDLYAAAWFGLVVSDPDGWLGQCYVEIQLYPDFSWSSPATSTPGVWSAAAVGWQIDPASGLVDTCFYSPLYLHGLVGDGFFSMSQGDAFQLRLLGWSGAPQGESVWINDTTSGDSSQVALYNATGNYPLDPAYSANDVQNALLWTTGGELPAAFAFEIGRSGNPGGITTSVYGGCTPGAKKSSPVDPSVPCPSYNPLSWVNDTLTPWTIGVPTFTNAATTSVPSQFGLSSTVGGAAAIPTLSNGTCGSHIGSAYCTYPWFSFSCTTPGFSFGATDFAAVTNDFGESAQYPSTAATSILGTPAYPMDNLSLPACGSGAHTVTLSTSGAPGSSIFFLSGDYTGTSTVSGIPDGNYSISALPAESAGFTGWTASGGVGVASLTSPSTSLTVLGNGAITATFSVSPLTSQVWFNSSLSGGLVVVTPAALYSATAAPTTVPAGTSINLTPGVYGIQAGPPGGNVFDGWSILSGAAGVALASLSSPVTWLTVTGGSSTAGIEATYSSTGGTASVNVTTDGAGTVTLGGVTVPYNGATGTYSEVVPVLAGTYFVTATPAAGWKFFAWTYGPSSVIVQFNATTNASFSPGVASLTATFAADVVSFNSPGDGGRVAVNDIGPLANGTTSWLPRGTYDLDALPFGGETFLHWTVSNSSALVVASSTTSVTRVTVNSNGTVTADFGSAATVNVTFMNSPSTGGLIRFNYEDISGPSTLNSSVTDGTYLLRAIPAGTWTFTGWSFSTNLSLVSGNLVVRGSGNLTAHYTRSTYGVSYVSEQSTIFINATIGGHLLTSGDTIDLAPGKYPLVALPGDNTTFLKWVTTGNLVVANPAKGTTNLTVSGGGTLSAIADGFVITGVVATPPATEVGVPVSFAAHYEGLTPLTYSWSGLPTGCTSSDVNPLVCRPTAPGTSTVVTTVTGANGVPLRSPGLSFEVNGSLSVSGLTASLPALDLGMTTDLTTAIAGGVGPYTYFYSSLPTGCSSANTSVLACTPTVTGSWSPEVTVTDAFGVQASKGSSVVVDPALDIHNLLASRLTVTATVAFVLTANATGGVPSLTYAYGDLPTGCASSDTSSLSCTPGEGGAGSYVITVTVTDAAGASGTASVAVLVNPLPSISSFSATPDQAVIGATVKFNVTALGGTGPLNYSFGGLPTGCTSENATTFSCQPILVGTFAITVTVTDVFAKSVTSSTDLSILPSSTTPTSTPASPFPWIWVVVAVVIVAAVAGLLLWWRSRPPPTPPPKLNPPAPAPQTPPPTGWDEGGG